MKLSTCVSTPIFSCFIFHFVLRKCSSKRFHQVRFVFIQVRFRIFRVLFSNFKGRRCKSVAHLGGELYRKRKTESESPSLTWAGSCTARPHTERGVGTKDTKNVDEKPDGKAEKERPRECLLLSCTARSSSIAVRQTAVESVQPGGERSNFADIFER